jgi:hypothetical protein
MTCGFRSWLVPVATSPFSTSCGIDTGSTAAKRYNHLCVDPRTNRSPHFGHAAQGEMDIVDDRLGLD